MENINSGELSGSSSSGSEGKTRLYGLDLVRITSLYLVIAWHFFMYTGYHVEPVDSKLLYVMTIIRTVSTCCVPMFMTLSGYLLCKKKVELRSYKGLIKILIIYLLCSFLCIAYKEYVDFQDYEWYSIARGILDYTAAPYAWYIEMYINLFLIAPFLNVLYNGLPSRKQKRALLFVFLLATALPGVINIYEFQTPGWWLYPQYSSDYVRFLPQWWTNLFPLTYYFLGCYLREFEWKLKPWKAFVLMIASFVATGTFCWYRSGTGPLAVGPWIEYESLLVVINCVVIFRFFLSIDYSHMPGWCGKILEILSECCLGGFLLSWIFDFSLYTWLNHSTEIVHERMKMFLPVTIAAMIGSLALSFVVTYGYKVVAGLFSKRQKQ